MNAASFDADDVASPGEHSSRDRRQHHRRPKCSVHFVPLETAERPRIAVCLAGGVRTLSSPAVYDSLAKWIQALDPRAVVLGQLSLRPENSVKGQREQVDASELGPAFERLRPHCIRFDDEDDEDDEDEHGGGGEVHCGIPCTGQFSKWRRCAQMAEAYERDVNAVNAGAAAGTGAGGAMGDPAGEWRFDWVVKVSHCAEHCPAVTRVRPGRCAPTWCTTRPRWRAGCGARLAAPWHQRRCRHRRQRRRHQ